MTTARAKTPAKKRASANAGRKPASKQAAAKAPTKRAARKVKPASSAKRPTANRTTDLLQAGFSAFSLPKAESAMADGLSRIANSFGLKRLEDVFDQRVAGALERMGYPSAEQLARLIDLLEELAAASKPRR